MSAAIRQVGIIPFTRSGVPGWSIEELTAPGCWFMDEDAEGVLGPWDWKIEVIAEGDIAYGKFIRNKAAFATAEWYRHLMNWRRSQAKYRIALGEPYPGNTQMDQLYKLFSPTLLSAIKEMGCVEGSDIRKIMTERSTKEQRSRIKGSLEKYLLPEVKRTAADYLNQYLEMGTWTVVGEFRRVYRGANLEYKGWQRSSITTPENLFDIAKESQGVFPGAQPVGHSAAAAVHPTSSPEGPATGNLTAGHATGNLAEDNLTAGPATGNLAEGNLTAGPATGNLAERGPAATPVSHGLAASPSAKSTPFWARFFDDTTDLTMPDCTPEESRDALIDKILESFPTADRSELLKFI